MKTIYQLTGEYDFLSIDYPSPIEVYNIIFPTVSHYFNAMKTTTFEEIIIVSKLNDPTITDNEFNIRPDWDDVKLSIMEYALQYKFAIPELATKLKETSGMEIINGFYMNIENKSSTDDLFWGYSLDENAGQNQLGNLLKLTRTRLICDSIHITTGTYSVCGVNT